MRRVEIAPLQPAAYSCRFNGQSDGTLSHCYVMIMTYYATFYFLENPRPETLRTFDSSSNLLSPAVALRMHFYTVLRLIAAIWKPFMTIIFANFFRGKTLIRKYINCSRADKLARPVSAFICEIHFARHESLFNLAPALLSFLHLACLIVSSSSSVH